MQRIEITLPTPAENVAFDEALLEWAEAENTEWEFLRLWEAPQPIVVVGRSSRVHREVEVSTCSQRGIPILRRTSGGAAIVAGPGCLMYGVVLSYRLRPELKDIGRAHTFVLNKLVEAVQPLLADSRIVQCNGTSDLVFVAPETRIGIPPIPLKFSGNSMRAKRTHLLYHGTLLYGFDLSLIESCLQMPPRQPDYREGRSHAKFVANLHVARESLVTAIDSAWPTHEELIVWPKERVGTLVENQFGQDHWNFEFD